MNKIIQLIPAPSNLYHGVDGGEAKHVVCLALVEYPGGDRDIIPMGITNHEIIDEVPPGSLIFFSDT